MADEKTGALRDLKGPTNNIYIYTKKTYLGILFYLPLKGRYHYRIHF